MSQQSIDVTPAPEPGYVVGPDGSAMKIPDGWSLLAPGDAALSRRIKKDGPSWTVKTRKGKRIFSKGILAPEHRIAALRKELILERDHPSYQKRLQASRKRAQKLEQEYRDQFQLAIITFLKFAPIYEELAIDLSTRITAHTIPVGSGTVARTKTIPIEQRAEAATIAWMRHQTTSYDSLPLGNNNIERRRIKKSMAKQSRDLLELYRKGEKEHLHSCPLFQALR